MGSWTNSTGARFQSSGISSLLAARSFPRDRQYVQIFYFKGGLTTRCSYQTLDWNDSRFYSGVAYMSTNTQELCFPVGIGSLFSQVVILFMRVFQDFPNRYASKRIWPGWVWVHRFLDDRERDTPSLQIKRDLRNLWTTILLTAGGGLWFGIWLKIQRKHLGAKRDYHQNFLPVWISNHLASPFLTHRYVAHHQFGSENETTLLHLQPTFRWSTYNSLRMGSNAALFGCLYHAGLEMYKTLTLCVEGAAWLEGSG